MEFITLTTKKMTKLAGELSILAENMTAVRKTSERPTHQVALGYLSKSMLSTAAELRRRAAMRPAAFADRPTAIFGDELELLKTLDEAGWITLSTFTTEARS